MATTLIGTLRPHAKGVHVQANAYNIMDVVTSADGSRAYMAVKDVPAGTALTNTAYWCIYTDMSEVKAAMENAAARADASAASANEAILNLTDYTSEYALRVRGEIAESAGNPVTIAPDEGSLVRPVTVFGPKQAGKGDPSPDNVRPISGYDALSLVRAGKNLFGGMALAKSLEELASGTINEEAGTVFFHGSGVNTRSIFFNGFKPNTQYTFVFYGKQTLDTVRIANLAIMYTDGNYQILSFQTAGEYSYCIVQTSSDRSVKYLFGIYANESVTLYYNKCGIFEGVVTLDDFEAYQGDTYFAHPGKTVYSGKVDWTKGKLAGNGHLVDGGSLNWRYWYDNMFYVGMLDVVTDCACEIYSNNGSEVKNGLFRRAAAPSTIYLRDDTLTEGDAGVTALKQKLTGHKIYYQYGSSHQNIPLTPHQILALKGANTLYGDGNSIKTVWVKPLETSIKERTEPLIERIAALEKAILNG